jgi:hypothetical protein
MYKEMARTGSIIQTNTDYCFICKRHRKAVFGGLDKHHIYGQAYRNKSEKMGLFVFICHYDCHIFGDKSVHKNAKVDLALKRYAQKKAMEYYGWSIEDFRKEFGKNYI